MSVKQMVYKGKPYLFADYRDLKKPEQQIQTLEEVFQAVTSFAAPVPVLTNVEGISLGPDYTKRAKELGKAHASKVGRQALLGITGLKLILLQGYMTFTGAKDLRAFASESEALDWLVG